MIYIYFLKAQDNGNLTLSSEVDLKDGGENIPVTQGNKQEYVDLYIDYVLRKSVSSQLEALIRGFFKVCAGQPIKLFRSEELQLVVCGNPHFDFKALEKVLSTKY